MEIISDCTNKETNPDACDYGYDIKPYNKAACYWKPHFPLTIDLNLPAFMLFNLNLILYPFYIIFYVIFRSSFHRHTTEAVRWRPRPCVPLVRTASCMLPTFPVVPNPTIAPSYYILLPHLPPTYLPARTALLSRQPGEGEGLRSDGSAHKLAVHFEPIFKIYPNSLGGALYMPRMIVLPNNPERVRHFPQRSFFFFDYTSIVQHCRRETIATK